MVGERGFCASALALSVFLGIALGPRLAGAAQDTPPPKPGQEDGSKSAPAPAASKEGTSWYPMPAFASDKDSGLTYGVLLGILFTDPEGVQNALVSASFNYNTTVKFSGEVEFRYSPDIWKTIDVDAYYAQKVENSLRLFYEDFKALEDYHARFESLDFRSTTDRFFGVGDNQPRGAEAVRTSNEYRIDARFGPRLGDGWDVEGTIRFRKFRVGESLITDLPQMLDKYPQQPGVEGGTVVAGGVRIVHDSRDNPTTPTSGNFANLYFERAEFLSPTNSYPYWNTGASLVTLWPLDSDKQFVTAVNVAEQVAVGNYIPFWELPALGGATTLRSFNGARFTNKGMILFNVEERIRVYRTSLFDVTGDVQVAPFFDLGKVYDSMDDLVGRGVWQNFHYSGGIGFRGVVAPSFVGRLDIAFGGGEGVGIIIGLDYPY
jgi:hypothetical protein